MKQYPADFRDRLLRALDAGLAEAAAARAFGVHPDTIARWRTRRAETGSPAPAARPGRAPLIDPSQHGRLRAQVAAHPDATLASHCDRWDAATGVRVSPATMSRLLAKLGLPLKKRPSSPASGTRPSGRRSGPRSPGATPPASSSSTRPAPRRR